MNKSNFSKLIVIFALIPFLLGFGFCFAEATDTTDTTDTQPETEQPKTLRILYQGQLTDSEGNPIEDGRYNMRFEIYDAKEQGNVLWSGEYTFYNAISLQEGQFKVILGRENPIELDLNQAPFWLAITIGSFTDENEIQWGEQLQPRKKITTLSELLGEKELTQEDWENLSELIEEKLKNQSDIVLLFDITQLENLEKGEDTDFSSEIYNTFRNLINFISEKILEIGEKLNIILDKLKDIISVLSEISYKVNALYNALIVEKGLAPEGEIDFGAETELENRESEQVSGAGIIEAGQRTVEIEDNLIQENSLIFIAFIDQPVALWQISKDPSEKSFTITLEEPTFEDLRFEYWILNKEGEEEFEQPEQGEESTDSEATPAETITTPEATTTEATTTPEATTIEATSTAATTTPAATTTAE